MSTQRQALVHTVGAILAYGAASKSALHLPQVIFKQLEAVDDDALHRTLFKKMAPPLVTLLSAEPEIQYVALRNINLIVQKYPTILAHEVKVRTGPGV